MAKITRPAVQIEQGDLTLYLTYVTPRDLLQRGFYTVDKLEPRQSGRGFQRILSDARANRLARHLKDAFPEGYANLPTTILLATSEPLEFNSKNNQLSFDTERDGPFSVVDGQHRIEGLVRASQDQRDLLDFQLPTTIATSLDHTHQMYHFYIVNTTQQPVEKGLQQQITSRFTSMQGVDELPYLPFWFKRRVEIGTDAQAIRLATFLNTESTSPLHGRIQLPNDSSPRRGRIKQGGLVTMFKSHIFSATNPISTREPDADKLNRMMLNYFLAVDELAVDDEERDSTIVYKNNGLNFFLSISKWVFTSIYSSTRDFTVESIMKTIEGAFAELEYEFQDVAEPQWWLPGGANSASALNRASARSYANAFLRALGQADTEEITV